MKKLLSENKELVIASDCKERSNRLVLSIKTAIAASQKMLLAMTTLVLAMIFIVSVPDVFAMGKKPKTFNIEIKVDFGPANKPGVEQTLEVERGSTAKDAVSQVFPVLSGKSCCSFREVVAIDGVKVEPEKSNWWICLLNGSKSFDPRKKELEPGDLVEWKYIHEERCPLGEKK